MKWYLAARTRHTEKLIAIAEHLKSQGQEISGDWIYVTDSVKPFTEHLPRVQEIVQNNLRRLFETNVFVFFNDTEGRDTFVEFGACLGSRLSGNNVTIYVIGDQAQASLMQMRPYVIHCTSLQEVFEKQGVSYEGFVFPDFKK